MKMCPLRSTPANYCECSEGCALFHKGKKDCSLKLMADSVCQFVGSIKKETKS